MHPLDGLLCGGHVIDAVGLAQCRPILFGWALGLPLASMLYQWDAVAATAFSGSYEYQGNFASDEDVIFIVYGDALLGED